MNEITISLGSNVNPSDNLDSDYGVSKLIMEYFYYSQFGSKLYILRLPNILDYHSKNKSIHIKSKSIKISKSILKQKKIFVSIKDINQKIKNILRANKKIPLINNCHSIKTSILEASSKIKI